jgi:hypothetical protein
MKLIILIFISLLSISSKVLAREFWVLDRKIKSNKTYFKKIALNDLVSDHSFDGKFFRIVEGTNSAPITFNSNKDLVEKAATVYYHLSRAREYWHGFAPENVNKNPIIIRLQITNQFDPLGHFSHQNRNPQFNNAVSVPAGKTPDWVPAGKQDEWDKEIWFRPLKYIQTTTLPKPQNSPVQEAVGSLQRPFINYTRNQFNQNLLEHLFYPNYATNPLWIDFVRFAGTVAVTQLIFEGSKYADGLFMEKFYYLDTAMVPEVIYHEYAHIMLSDQLELTHSTSVTEGMADYFAAVISKRRKIAARVRGFSNAQFRDRNNNSTYTHWHESNNMAQADFVLALLWDIREVLGEQKADQLIFEARKKLKVKTATIYNHLLQALYETCLEKCQDPQNDKLKLFEIFTQRGF